MCGSSHLNKESTRKKISHTHTHKKSIKTLKHTETADIYLNNNTRSLFRACHLYILALCINAFECMHSCILNIYVAEVASRNYSKDRVYYKACHLAAASHFRPGQVA